MANAAGAAATSLPSTPEPVPITHAPPHGTTGVMNATREASTGTLAAAPQLYRAVAPSAPVTIKQLDAALVDYLRLRPAAQEIQAMLAAAGLDPPPDTGSEAIARLLDLRIDHPAAEDDLELLPDQSATLGLGPLFARPGAPARPVGGPGGPGRRRLLHAARCSMPGRADPDHRRRRVGSRTSGVARARPRGPFGVDSPGGFDCSGFVWRDYKLTAYPDEKRLAWVLRGRTTYLISGEVPRSDRIRLATSSRPT